MRGATKAITVISMALLILALNTCVHPLLEEGYARARGAWRSRPMRLGPVSWLIEISPPGSTEAHASYVGAPAEGLDHAAFRWPPEIEEKELSLLGQHRAPPASKHPAKPVGPGPDVLNTSPDDLIITGEEMWVDQVVVLNGNLIVKPGGNLTLINVTLIVNCTYEGQYQIRVEAGGELHILQGSNVTAWDLEKPFTFLIRSGSTFEMLDSELHGCGYSSEHPGLIVRATGVLFEGCSISHNFYGVSVIGGNVTFQDCVITANYKGLYCEGGAALVGDGCSITGNWWEGVDAWDSTLKFSDCEITDNGHEGLRCVGSELYVTGCNVSLNHGDGVFLMSSQAHALNSVFNNNTGWGVSCDLSTMTLYSCDLSFNWLDGIDAYGGSCVVAEGCSISYNGLEGFWSGVSCQFDSNAEVRDCTIIGNGLDGVSCEESWILVEGCEVAENYRFGVYAYRSSGIVVRDNVFVHDTLFLEGDELAHFLHTIEGNTVNEKPLYYIVNSVGATIDRPIGSLLVVNSRHITVFTGSLTEKVNISRTDVAVEVAFSEDVVLRSCYIDQNGWYGVYVYNSSETVLEHSIVSRNGYGVYCAGESQLTIHYCNIFSNTGPGLYVEPPSSVDARDNWWGSVDGPEESEVGDPDPPEEVWGDVAYDPWLDIPTCWADFDGDEVPNFLDNPAFNVHIAVRSGTYKLVIVPGVVEFEFDWPVGVYVITPANTLEEMLLALGEWGIEFDEPVFFALPIVIDVGGLLGGFFDVLANFLPHAILTTAETKLMDQDGRFRLLIIPTFGVQIDYWDAMQLLFEVLVELKDLFTGGLTIEDVEDLLSLLDVYHLDIKFYVLFESVTYLSQGVWALDLRTVLNFISKLSALTRISISIVTEIADALISGIGLFSIIEELAEKILNLMVDYLSEWVPAFALAEEILDYVRHLMSLVKMLFGFGDPPSLRLDVSILKVIRAGDEVVYEPLLKSWCYNYTDGGLMLWDPHEYLLLMSKEIFPIALNITVSGVSGAGPGGSALNQPLSINYTLVARDLQFDRTVVCGGSLDLGEHTTSVIDRDVATNQTLMNYLALDVSFSNVRPHQGEEVVVDITVIDQDGIIVADADLSLTFNGKPVAVEQLEAGRFRATLSTSRLYGLAVVRIYAEKEGYLPGLAVQPIYVIDDIPPEVSVEHPVNGTHVRGSVPIRVNASDTSGIEVVEVYVNGVLLSADEEAPYELEWNTTAWPDGLVNITALARDRAGNEAEETIWVIVDNTPPVIRITAPEEGMIISTDTVEVAWEVSDEQGIAEVELSVDEGSWQDVTGLTNYTLSGLGEGSHKVVLKATDLAGNTAEDAVVFTVQLRAEFWPTWALVAGVAVLTAIAASALILRRSRARS